MVEPVPSDLGPLDLRATVGLWRQGLKSPV